MTKLTGLIALLALTAMPVFAQSVTGTITIQDASALKGPKGDAGAQGLIGPVGPQGPIGPAGPAGASATVTYSNGTCSSGVLSWPCSNGTVVTPPPPTPVNCVVSAWMQGSLVPATCPTSGVQTRTDTRTILTQPANGGTACPALTQTVNVPCTPVVVNPPPTGPCPMAQANVPGGSDGVGGCFPGVDNTGPNAPASSMQAYTGPCTIATPNTVIDSKVVNCRNLIPAAGFVLKNSYLFGSIGIDGGTASFTVQDSVIDSSVSFPACLDGSCQAGKYACGDTNNQTGDCGITGANFTILRTEQFGSNRAAFCEANCLIQDSYFHGTNLWPDASNKAHASSVREQQGLTLRHNSIHCSYTGPFVNSEIGCSADLTGYADFAPIKNNTVDGNLFVADIGGSYCAYGGATPGKPFSSDPTNATNQKFTNNVFQRGTNRKCGFYAPIDAFDPARTGNVWFNNKWDDGTVLPPN